MNYLAHLFLAGDNPDEKLGSLIADFTRGRLETLAGNYSPGIMRGIAIHRKIDQFTDQHTRVLRSKRRFSDPRRRYAGIIVDVLHDHFLSRHWYRHSDMDRGEFIASVYRLLQRNQHVLPSRMQWIAPLMIDQDWLGSYHYLDRIGEAYDRMSRRLRQPNNLAGAVVEVRKLYQLLERDFEIFFPELRIHVDSLG